MLDPVLEAIEVLLPLVIAVMSVAVGVKLAKNPTDRSHKWWVGGIVALGLICSGVTLWEQQRSRRAHSTEVDGQREALKNLQAKLDESEIRRAAETKYLEGQLSVLSQFGPGVLKLAETTAEFTRKQYESKVSSDRELYSFTMGVVTKLRDGWRDYDTVSHQQYDDFANFVRQGRPEAEQHQKWSEFIQKSTDLSNKRDAEFRTSILPQALIAREELMKRKLSEPTVSPEDKRRVELVLRGMSVGPNPELTLASYLEIMARPLSQK
jgi:hypothetical protein